MSRVVVLVLLGSVLWGLAPRSAEAHLPPPITFSFAVDAEEVTWEVTLSAGLFEEWLPFEAQKVVAIAERGGDEYDELLAAVGDWFQEWGRVAVDDIPVRGLVRKVAYTQFMDHMTTWEFVILRMGYPTKGKPRRVHVTWTNYDGGLGGYFDRIDTEVDGFGETEYHVVRAREPEFTWHAPRAKPIPRRLRLPRRLWKASWSQLNEVAFLKLT